MEIPIYQVDAFASEVFAGNPAAVCPLEAWLPDDVMQAIALENNLSETAFFVRRGDAFDLRWFTPTVEADMCGHATLGSAFVILNYLEPERREARFHTRSGELIVTRDGNSYCLDLPAQPPERAEDSADVAAALGAEPTELWRSMYMMAVFADEAQIANLTPDFAKVAELEKGEIIVTAPGNTCDFVSRFFAPGAGIPEDPVTGSAHTILAPYWAQRLGKTHMAARQISRRGGELAVEARDDRVLLTGQVAPYLQGHIRV
ncbi:MAG: PhzF family phenazine biosynthesis protein [Alphaproteobacteria bacterium]